MLSVADIHGQRHSRRTGGIAHLVPIRNVVSRQTWSTRQAHYQVVDRMRWSNVAGEAWQMGRATRILERSIEFARGLRMATVQGRQYVEVWTDLVVTKVTRAQMCVGSKLATT